MRVVTGREMLAIDQHSIAEGMPASALMELAGASVARMAEQMCDGIVGKRIYILCGSGNNGGDGFVAARHLANAGAKVRVFFVGTADRLQGEAASFYHIFVKSGGQVTLVGPVNERLRFTLGLADLVIDALLGTGLHEAPRQPMAELIAAVNELKLPVLAVDVPSGVDSDNGQVPGVAIRASQTVCFGLHKLGLLLYPGAALAGQVKIAHIGFPAHHLEWSVEGWPQRILLDHQVVKGWSAPRQRDTHKGSYGRVLVVAGSQGMVGAGALTTLAALRTGAGLVTWAGPESVWPLMAQKVTEATTLGLPIDSEKSLSTQAVSVVIENLHSNAVLALGPGLGRHDDTIAFVQQVLASAKNPTVIDADGLYALAQDNQPLHQPNRRSWVLTPHPGEAAQLLRCSIAEIETDRLAALQKLVDKYQCIVVLKGVPTLVSGPSSPIYINSTGNPGMATGGSGDVLTGIVASFMAQGLSPLQAAAAGVYLHGMAGDYAASKGEAGLIAGDLLTYLPKVVAGCWEFKQGASA